MDSHEFYAFGYLGLCESEYFYFGAAQFGAPPLGGGIRGGYCIWRYAGGKWLLVKDACEPGFLGRPPRENGNYEGEFRRTPGGPDPGQ
jgi:hypothetical protein